MSLQWPENYADPGSHWSADQLLAGFHELGIVTEPAEIPQEDGSQVVVLRVLVGSRPELIAFDHSDFPEIDEGIAGRVLVYFKQQYRDEGYTQPNIVPGGYTPANAVIYRYLSVLRAIRRSRRFRWDVYCRFGMKWGGQEMRGAAHEILSARSDFRYEGSLFRYPGGPDALPYRQYLFEIPRAKVCVDMPGAGDFTTRLLDYLAIGACVVKPPPRSRLPVRLIDGVHVVYCAEDLSDLGDVCAQLVRDNETREAIARNARGFFDQYLQRRQVAQRYVDTITDARGESPRDAIRPAESRPAGRVRTGSPVVSRLMIALVLLLGLVAVPEALGDRPFDPQPSRVLHALGVLIGTSGSDRLVGTSQGDRIFGSSGNDEIRSRAGIDFLFGGPGDDILRGGGGKDYLSGGTGNDTLYVWYRDGALDDFVSCGPGDDTAVVANVPASDRARIRQMLTSPPSDCEIIRFTGR